MVNVLYHLFCGHATDNVTYNTFIDVKTYSNYDNRTYMDISSIIFSWCMA